MKKQILILASAMLLASCGGNGNQPAYSEKSGVPVADVTELNAPLAKLAENLASTKKIGIEAKFVESVDASFRTVANADLGLKDATYPIKSNGNVTIKAGFDLDAFKGSLALDSKLSASAKFPSVDVVTDGAGEYSLVTKDMELNIPETSLAAKAYLDDNRVYVNIDGAKSGLKNIINEVNKLGLYDLSPVTSAIDELPSKFKSPALPEEAAATVKAFPETIGQYVGSFGMLLVSYISSASSMPVESGEFNLIDHVKVEKVDNDYRIALDVGLSDVAPLILGLAGVEYNEVIGNVLKALDANCHVSVTFNENALISANFGLNASAKNLKPSDFIGSVEGAESANVVTDINANLAISAGLNFKYGNDVVIESLAAGEKANYQDFGDAE